MFPVRIAFYDEDGAAWIVVDLLVDLMFLFDIIFNFFLAYFDKEENLIMKKPVLRRHYLKTWFAFDLVPLSSIFIMYQDGQSITFRFFGLLK